MGTAVLKDVEVGIEEDAAAIPPVDTMGDDDDDNVDDDDDCVVVELKLRVFLSVLFF